MISSFILLSLLISPFVLLIFIIMSIKESQKENSSQYNAKYVFYYLLSLVALIFISLSVGLIIFGIIDKSIYDALDYANYYSIDSNLKFAISSLLIATPIFYIISRLINKGLKKGEINKESAIRRWLVYFIILVSSLIILGTFISLINNFLSGELTYKFILKVLTILIISGTVFSYYFYDIKRQELLKGDKVVKAFFIVTLTIIIAVFVSAWFFVESPQAARDRRFDDLLLNNFSQIETAVNDYYSFHNKFPESLDDLINDERIYLSNPSLVNPGNGERIVYQVVSKTKFELCADFKTSSLGLETNNYYNFSRNREHDSGYQCLTAGLWQEPEAVAKEPKTLIENEE